MEIAFENEVAPQKESAIGSDTKPKSEGKPKIDVDFDTGITPDEVDQRESELTDALASFIMLLLDSQEYTLDDLGLTKDDLSAILDDIESALAFHGIVIYRPVLIEDEEDGTQHIYYSQYDETI